MPVRKVSNWGGNIIGSFPSLKMDQSVPYESTIERDLLFFLEYDQSVLRYEMQPLTITATDFDGKQHRYTPDVQIIGASEKFLVECKPAALVASPSAQRQISIGQEWANANDHSFVVVTDLDLRNGYKLENLKLLWRYSRYSVPYSITNRCVSLLSVSIEGVTFKNMLHLLNGIIDPLKLPSCLYSLLFRHVVDADLNCPLKDDSLIWLSTVRS